MNLTPPPAATAPNLQALREAYRRDKAALVATLFAPLPTVRGIHGLLRKFTRLADRLLQTLWKASALHPGLALLAVGGFGRGQLLPYSDVDVLVLLPDSSHAALGTDTRARVEDFIRNCWDAGLEIGSSVRSVQECLEEAAGDVTVQTSLLEARRICGSASLFAHFEREFRASIDPRAFLTAKTLEMRQRHNKYENTAYALEPNAKESPGGLRDLQTILWVADAAAGVRWLPVASPRPTKCTSSSATKPCCCWCVRACTPWRGGAKTGWCSICKLRWPKRLATAACPAMVCTCPCARAKP